MNVVEVDFRGRNNPDSIALELPRHAVRYSVPVARRYRIMEAVADAFGYGDPDQLRTWPAPRHQTWALHVSMYLMAAEGEVLEEIGITTRRTPGAVASGIRHVSWDLWRNPGLAPALRALMQQVNGMALSKRHCRVCGESWWGVVGVRSGCPYKARHKLYPAPAVLLHDPMRNRRADLTGLNKQAHREL